MSDQIPAGFEIPLHRSLTEPLLLAGASRSVDHCDRHIVGGGRSRSSIVAGGPADLD